MKTIKCIMLIDDNPDDNFFHERVIRKNEAANHVVAMTSATQALAYLKEKKDENLHPDLIFLDINMPGMNGWEFLEQYEKLDDHFKSKAVVVMLTTSENPDDHAKSLALNIACDFRTKPLTTEMLEEIFAKYF